MENYPAPSKGSINPKGFFNWHPFSNHVAPEMEGPGLTY